MSRRLQGATIRRIVRQMFGARNGSHTQVEFQEEKFFRAIKVRGAIVAQCEAHGSHDVHDAAARATFLPIDRVAERIRVRVGRRGSSGLRVRRSSIEDIRKNFKGVPGSNRLMGRVAQRFSIIVIGGCRGHGHAGVPHCHAPGSRVADWRGKGVLKMVADMTMPEAAEKKGTT